MNEYGRPALVVKDLHRSFASGSGKLEVLRGVDFTADCGEVLAVVGHSGIGKSTLLNIVGALDRPTRGEVILNGVSLGRLADSSLARVRRDEVGYVFQMFHLLPEFTAVENVMMPALIGRPGGARMREYAMELLAQVGLEDRSGSYPWQLSGGEQQRVAVARAMVNDPRVVLADEPTGNLDEDSAERVLALLWDLAATRGRVLIMATHDTGLARRAKRVLRMVDGVTEEE